MSIVYIVCRFVVEDCNSLKMSIMRYLLAYEAER